MNLSAVVVKLVAKFYSRWVVLVVVVLLLVVAVATAGLFFQLTHARGEQMEWLGGLMQMIGDSVQNNKNLTATQLTNTLNRKHFKRDRAVAFSREDSSIQRRVADAKAAGVHPLFALGASVQSSPVFGPQAEAPRFSGNTGAAMASMIQDRQANETHQAALQESQARTDLLRAEKDNVVARMLADSAAARQSAKSNVTQDIVKVPAQAKEYVLPGEGPKYSPFRPKGEGWVTSKSARAQEMEDEYGEVTDWTYGPYRALSDWVWYNEGWKYFVPNQASHGVYRQQYPRRR